MGMIQKRLRLEIHAGERAFQRLLKISSPFSMAHSLSSRAFEWSTPRRRSKAK